MISRFYIDVKSGLFECGSNIKMSGYEEKLPRFTTGSIAKGGAGFKHMPKAGLCLWFAGKGKKRLALKV